MMSVKHAHTHTHNRREHGHVKIYVFSPLKASRLETAIVAHAWNLRH